MLSMIADSLGQLLETHCTEDFIRQLEAQGQNPDFSARRACWAGLWSELDDCGFASALISEEQGGVGLGLDAAGVIAEICGRHGLPLPLVHTNLVRAALSATGAEIPAGAIAIAEHCQASDDACSDDEFVVRVPFGLTADWVLAAQGEQGFLLKVQQARVVSCPSATSQDAFLGWPATQERVSTSIAVADIRVLGACANAGLLAGALGRVMEMTLEYANQRAQFGKPIGKFQAVQQQLSVLAEEVYVAAMAARIGFAGELPLLPTAASYLAVATAKSQTSAAAARVSAIAHGVHGAIGFTEEYALQIYTRRLHEWRLGYGAESYWAQQIGRAVLRDESKKALDYVLSGS